MDERLAAAATAVNLATGGIDLSEVIKSMEEKAKSVAELLERIEDAIGKE